MAQTLPELIAYLDGLQGPAPLGQLAAHLRELTLDEDDLARRTRFSSAGYQRNLYRAGKWYHLWVLCWKNGQRSPIHDHAGSGCAVRVVRHVKATGSADLAPGSVLLSKDTDLHQVSNLQADDADLITLHVYSPPLVRMGTYSLTEPGRGEDVWWEETRKVVTAFPENSETPLERLQGWVTPNRLFFVRNHFDAPAIDRATWRLRVAGGVREPRAWTWDELTALPARSVFATVECAGNGRSFLTPRVHGVQWGAGAIGHAEWTGVPVRDVLEQSGISPGAVEVLFEGADVGTESDHPEPMPFARSLPLDKALHPDTLLVYRMNGDLLEPAHGYPLRLFVPGWYGVAAVKWLQRIEVLDRPFGGYYQTKKYTYQRRTPDGTTTEVVGPMAVKSEVFRPQSGATLGVGTNRIFGVAWAGEEAVERVEVSVDGGNSWAAANLLGVRAPYSWTLWEYLWEAARPGTYTLLTRATSTSGRTQPTEHDTLHGGYLIHHSRPIEVRIETAAVTAAARGGDVDSLLWDMNAYAEEQARMPLDVYLEFSLGEGI
jgi:DMSO/TMAO reductase YedYZ molybdopterin-dependent catalytic subunit